MSLFGQLLNFGRQVTTVTVEDIDARIRRAEGSVPPREFVLDNAGASEEAVKADIVYLPGDIVVGSQVYDAKGRVPADEWERLNRIGETYVASLGPMKRDPLTSRPTRD